MSDGPPDRSDPTTVGGSLTPSGPVFIVGSPRSGSSILAVGLRAGGGYLGAFEGHLLPLLGRLLHEVTDYYDARADVVADPFHLLAEVPASEVRLRLGELFRALYLERHGGPWYDKTVGCDMLRLCPTMLELWPDARIVFAKRRGIENVLSRLRKYPLESFESHCTAWAETVMLWLRVRPLLGDRWVEIEQRDIALDPQGTAERLRGFLGLDGPRGSAIAEVFVQRRPQQTAPPDDARAVALSATGWSDEWIELFRGICGDAMRALGYGLDDYHLPDGPDPTVVPLPSANAAQTLAEYGAYHGHVDRSEGGVVEGWARNDSRPDERVRLDVFIDGNKVTTGIADVFREDLLAAGIGDGRHGFRIALPPELANVTLDDLRVRLAATAQRLRPRR